VYLHTCAGMEIHIDVYVLKYVHIDDNKHTYI